MMARWGARLFAGALLLGLTAPTLLVGTTQPAAAADGVVAVEPSEGKTNWGNIRLVTDRACPADATSILVQVTGGNFPPNSNAVGNTQLDEFGPGANGSGMVIPLFGSWDTVAQANGATETLDGIARLTLSCLNEAGTRSLADFTGEVKFARTNGGASGYEQADGPRLASGLPIKASALQNEYVYRYDLPPGSPGGPPAGGPTSAADAVAVANGAAIDQGSSPGSSSGSVSDGGATADAGTAGTDSQTSVPGASVDTQATSSDRSSGASSTALIVGLVVLLGAASAGYVFYERARRQPPSRF